MKVALIFGGQSVEHEVSIVSARHVENLLKEANFEVVLVGITRSGRWLMGDHTFQALCAAQPDKLAGSRFEALVRLEQSHVQLVFPLIHGTTGEDGCIQGLCELLNVPFVGGGVLNQSMCWDKLTTKTLFKEAGLPQAKYLAFFRHTTRIEEAATRVEERLPYPVFVKPSRTGSSIGISKVYKREHLKEALKLAFSYDYRVLVEEGLAAREIEIAGCGGLTPRLSVAGEIQPQNDFYDFDEKYLNANTKFQVPAKLTDHLLHQIREYSYQAWSLLNCYGMARIDFLVTEDIAYLNEVNTTPGFTQISMYPRLFREAGVSGTQLMKELVTLALDRHQILERQTQFLSSRNWFKESNCD